MTDVLVGPFVPRPRVETSVRAKLFLIVDDHSRLLIDSAFYAHGVDRRWERTHELIRRWCGTDAVERFDELATLRKEVLRIGQVAERAIRALAEHGRPQVARRLEEELGVPVSLLRASQRPHRSGP